MGLGADIILVNIMNGSKSLPSLLRGSAVKNLGRRAGNACLEVEKSGRSTAPEAASASKFGDEHDFGPQFASMSSGITPPFVFKPAPHRRMTRHRWMQSDNLEMKSHAASEMHRNAVTLYAPNLIVGRLYIVFVCFCCF